MSMNPLSIILYRPDLGTRNGETIYGEAKGFVIWIREDMRGDKGVLEHELEHVRQFWKHGLLIHMILLWYPPYRAWCEKKALEKQYEAQ
jgi:hypothetical protein